MATVCLHIKRFEVKLNQKYGHFLSDPPLPPPPPYSAHQSMPFMGLIFTFMYHVHYALPLYLERPPFFLHPAPSYNLYKLLKTSFLTEGYTEKI